MTRRERIRWRLKLLSESNSSLVIAIQTAAMLLAVSPFISVMVYIVFVPSATYPDDGTHSYGSLGTYVAVGAGIAATIGIVMCAAGGIVTWKNYRRKRELQPEALDAPAASFSLLRFRGKLKDFSASGLTDLAALLAGRRGLTLRVEWRAHLGGESGRDPVTWRKVWQALGFVGAAIQLRLQDAADLAWRPVDAILGSRTLSNLFISGPVIVVLFAIVHHDGRFGLVADIQDPVALGAFLYGVIRTGRWWRGIKPPPPRARSAQAADTSAERGGPSTEG